MSNMPEMNWLEKLEMLQEQEEWDEFADVAIEYSEEIIESARKADTLQIKVDILQRKVDYYELSNSEEVPGAGGGPGGV